MNQIIGNQEQRKSKIDTEKWKEHSAYYSNPKNVKKAEKRTPVATQGLENKVLRYGSKGKPELRLVVYPNILVHTTTNEEYDLLMQVYESAGWNWKGTGSLPTEHNMYKAGYFRNTCISVEKNFRYEHATEAKKNHSTMSIELFVTLQGITPIIVEELNNWYDTHKPERASKG